MKVQFSASSAEENVYMNMPIRNTEAQLSESLMDKAPTTKEKSTSNIKKVVLIILLILFLILVVITGVLLKYYLGNSKEMSHQNHDNVHLNNGTSDLKNKTGDQRPDVKNVTKTDIGTCSKTCPSDWELIRSDCYYFSSSSETWKRSKEICAGSNGILLVIKDESEMTSLLPIIMEERYWIGLRRDPKNITMWLWTDGSPLTYSVWNKDEPNNERGNEHCVEIMGGVQAWNDRSCQDREYYICKGVWSC